MFWRLQRQETFRPITSCTLQLVGGKAYAVTVMDMESHKLAFDCSELVININRILGLGKDRRLSFDETPKCDTFNSRFSVLHHTFKKMFTSQAVGLDILKNLCHCGRRQQVFLRRITSLTATSTTRHPEKKGKGIMNNTSMMKREQWNDTM